MLDIQVQLGDESFAKAQENVRTNQKITAESYRNRAVAHYGWALKEIIEAHGEHSWEASELYLKIGLAYKWVLYDAQAIEKGLSNLLKVEDIWNQNRLDHRFDLKRYVSLCVDIGGVWYMGSVDEKAFEWRLKAYKEACDAQSVFDKEALAQIELSLKVSYNKLYPTQSYTQFLKENKLSPIIESVETIPIAARYNKYKVKLLGDSTIYEWIMG